MAQPRIQSRTTTNPDRPASIAGSRAARFVLTIAVICGSPAAVSAGMETVRDTGDGAASAKPPMEWQIGGSLSTLGPGVEIKRVFGKRYAVRANANATSYDVDRQIDGIAYTGRLKLQTAGAMFDWHPFETRFRLTYGAFYNRNEARVTAQPGTAGFEFNGVTYDVADTVGGSGKLSFHKFAPYLGFGWATSPPEGRGWTLSTDLGVLFQGEPNFDLDIGCSTTLAEEECIALTADLDREVDDFEKNIKNYQFYPVLAISFGARF